MSNNNQMSLKKFNNYIESILPEFSTFDISDKQRNISIMINHTINRLQSMFSYKNLPDTIPQKYLEFYLMLNGHCAIADVDGSLYALIGSFGGVPDPYYLPVNYVVANPYLKLSKTYKRDIDCIVCANDPLYYGLLPMLKKYITLIAENELSMNISVINSRTAALICAPTDQSFESAKKYIDDIKDGKLGVIGDSAFFDGIKVQPYGIANQSNGITSLIEYEQYLKASLLNDLGLNANYNMKRESINSNESQLNDDMLSPFIDIMLKCRKENVDKINSMFGTEIEVDFDSAWLENKLEHSLTLVNTLSTISDPGEPEQETEPETETEPEQEQETEETEETEEIEETEETEETEEIEETEETEETEEIEEIEEIKKDIAEGILNLLDEEVSENGEVQENA